MCDIMMYANVYVVSNCDDLLKLQVSATDGDDDMIEYVIISGAQGVFAINASTGVISMNATLDREKQDEARLEIRATDNGNDTCSGDKDEAFSNNRFLSLYNILYMFIFLFKL